MDIRAATEADRELVAELLVAAWGTPIVVAHGIRYDAGRLPALIAWDGERAAGLLTYSLGPDDCEVVTLDAFERGNGAGTALLAAAATLAEDAGLNRLWLITTNDNVDGLRFYQRRGMRITAIAVDAIAESRRIKPEIPETGEYGIPIRDEITLEMRLPRPAPRH